MSTNLIVCIIVALAMILCPIAAVGGNEDTEPNTESAVSEILSEDKVEEYISVMASSTGKIEKIGMREYVVGSVAAEMSPLYHTEALKAQAVASYTYAKRIMEQNEKNKDSSLGDADISDSPDTHQGYINKKQRKEKWDDKYDEYEKKIEDAVDEVYGLYMSYDGETVLAVYHSNCAGATQSAKTLWDSDIPYLVSVESPGDKLSPDYVSKNVFSESEFKSLAKGCGVKLSGDAEEWVGDTEKDENGYVMAVEFGSDKISSSKIREEFELRSNCFDIDYKDGSFTITCYGYGHGVGMSQYGADYMARQGISWQEILKHYYAGIEIEQDSGS